MNELAAVYAEARFGKELVKEAAEDNALVAQLGDYLSMPGLNPESRKLRNLIEQTVTEEDELREQARQLLAKGKERYENPQMGGMGTFLYDLIRSAIPGLDVSASDDDGIVKSAVEEMVEEEAVEEEDDGSAFDVAHALTAATGGGLGAAVQRGALGGAGARNIAERMAGGPGALRDAIIGELVDPQAKGKAMVQLREQLQQLGRKHDLGMAAQHQVPLLEKLRKFSPSALLRRLKGLPLEKAPSEAMESLMKDAPGQVKKLLDKGGLRRAGDLAMKNIRAGGSGWRPGWGKGALIGSLLLSAPFLIHKLLKTRSLRARGGTAAETAAGKAEKLLARAEGLKKKRKGAIRKSKPKAKDEQESK